MKYLKLVLKNMRHANTSLDTNLHPASADIRTFATLSNLKILMPHEDPTYLVVQKHFLTPLLENLLSTIYVDEKWYTAQYPDIRESIERGDLRSASEHFIRFGWLESRMPYRIQVVEEWYLDQYADVRAAVHREDFMSGQEHFDLRGYREGRLPHANFYLIRA